MRRRFCTITLTTAGLLLLTALPRAAAEPRKWPGCDCPGSSPASSRLVQRAYAVADLVVPVEDAPSLPAPSTKARKPATPQLTRKPSKPATLENRLMKLIGSMVQPDSWSEQGGSGNMDYYPLGMALVVRQTPEAHEEIEQLLSSLRRLQDIQVSVELRFGTICDEGMERVGIDFENPEGSPIDRPVQPEPSAFGVKLLNDAQVFQLMERIQGDRRASILAAPKVTTFNGQRAAFSLEAGADALEGAPESDATEAPLLSGIRFTVCPVIAGDQRTVRLALDLSLAIPGQETVHARRTLNIPDGGTALLSGWTHTSEVRREYGPPAMLSKVPYVNRLFKNVAFKTETRKILVLATPRIIVNEEEEVKPAAAEAPATASRELTTLVANYRKACAAGRLEEATRFAVQALALDPTCFSKNQKVTASPRKSR